MTVFLFFMVCFGFSMCAMGEITLPLRNRIRIIKGLLECPMCTGFWAGFTVSYFGNSPACVMTGVYGSTPVWLFVPILDGFAAAAFNLILFTIVTLLANLAAKLSGANNGDPRDNQPH